MLKASSAHREISTSLLESKGLVLRRKAQVAQNGAFNKIRGRYNPLELWQVPYKTEAGPEKKRRK